MKSKGRILYDSSTIRQRNLKIKFSNDCCQKDVKLIFSSTAVGVRKTEILSDDMFGPYFAVHQS